MTKSTRATSFMGRACSLLCQTAESTVLFRTSIGPDYKFHTSKKRANFQTLIHVSSRIFTWVVPTSKDVRLFSVGVLKQEKGNNWKNNTLWNHYHKYKDKLSHWKIFWFGMLIKSWVGYPAISNIRSNTAYWNYRAI